MKNIKPINIWNDGQIKIAKYFDIIVSQIVLGNSAQFFYRLSDESSNPLSQGTLNMDGQDYQDWSSDDYVWDWAAQQLNIEYDLDNSIDSNS